MEAVETRELKQNLKAVIRRVVETGAELEITTHGRPSGVRLVPDQVQKSRWAPGSTLAQIEPLTDAQRAAWKSDLLSYLNNDIPVDPWGERP